MNHAISEYSKVINILKLGAQYLDHEAINGADSATEDAMLEKLIAFGEACETVKEFMRHERILNFKKRKAKEDKQGN